MFENNDNANAWLSGTASVMCATSGFRMGIDKPDIHFVVHLSLLKSLEEYYQEAGQTGHDGKNLQCMTTYCHKIENKQKGHSSRNL